MEAGSTEEVRRSWWVSLLFGLIAIAFGLCSWIYLEYSWTEEAFWPPQLAGLLFSIAGMVIGTLLPQFKRNDNGMLVAQPQ